jgi:hypothetical protein
MFEECAWLGKDLEVTYWPVAHNECHKIISLHEIVPGSSRDVTFSSKGAEALADHFIDTYMTFEPIEPIKRSSVRCCLKSIRTLADR